MRSTPRLYAGRVRWMGAALLALLCGCQQNLETGYKYHPLNATPAQRRAYYASPFSPEAQEGAKESSGSGYHKPGGI